jgi:ATP-dependent helicase/nuclease subunit A
LEAFPRSRVSTLDSFCADIAGNASARWGVAPGFAIDQEAAADALESFAIGFLLARRHDPVAASFIAANGFESTVKALLDFAGGRHGLIASNRRFDADEQSQALGKALAELHGRLYRAISPGLELDAARTAGAAAWQAAAAKVEPVPPDPGAPDELAAAFSSYEAISALRVCTGKSEAAVHYNDVGAEAKKVAAAAMLACEALRDGRRAGAGAMLADFVAEAAEARSGSGVLAFADVSSMAVATLADDLALRDWYKSRYDAIMVDEFQDDNEQQKRLLYYLAERRDRRDPGRGRGIGSADLEPGVLFFVGDEKQSIYGFRGADVTVFRGLSGELAAAPGGLGEHRLPVNWRSEPALIDFLNETFSRIMPPPAEPDAMDYEARFDGLGSGPATADVEPAVVYLESNEPDDEAFMDSGEAEAWALGELVRSLVGKVKVSSKGRGGGKESSLCRYEDIAVLFRSTTTQNVVERYFRLLDIPYTAASTAGLYAESILGDLYAMLRLTAYPDDRLAFAAALRGPFARLSDDSVFEAMSPGCEGDEGLWGFDGSALATEDAARYGAAKETWLWLRERADRESLARLVEYLWYERGLRWNVLENLEAVSFLEHFDYIWAIARAADARGDRLVDLVAQLEPMMGTYDKYEEGSIPRESSRGVSIMTVHRSKGLEFPVVIVPDMDNVGRASSRSPITQSGAFGASIRMLDAELQPRDPVAELESRLKALDRGEGAAAMDESLAELVRLFYVACTRAISRLYLIGKVPRNADKSRKSFRGLLLEAWPWAGPANGKDEDFISDRPLDAPAAFSVEYVRPRSKEEHNKLTAGSRYDGRARAERSASAKAAAVPMRKARWQVTGAAAWLEAQGTTPTIRTEAARKPSDQSGPGVLDDASFGTLCHMFIESMLKSPGSKPEAGGSVLRELEALGTAARVRVMEEAMELARVFIDSPRGLEAAKARQEAATDPEAVFEVEYPFYWRDGAERPVLLSGSMDLVYGGRNGVVVVDFKTDRTVIPEKHQFQLSVYRDAAESIFGAPASAWLWYLREGIECRVEGKPETGLLGSPEPPVGSMD